MLPSVVIAQVKDSLLDYLRTTFQLRDEKLEQALFRFLVDEKDGLFRGPYIDVRLPFRKADPELELPVDVGPPFTPYLHQLRAFERLTSKGDHQPESTLVTTGTGSGKTECFLYPLLDHCRRERQRGSLGIKAIILYPMNALASDQAERIARELQRPELRGISAGLYVGGKGEHGDQGPTYLVDKRDVLRKSPPDILLTNYRMLDLLLLRPEDCALWGMNGPRTLQYLVLDELHTYDGAQGSDVACLIRRLKQRLSVPAGHLCCVGTSATIGSGETENPRRLLVEFASKVFGEPFEDAAIVGEDRLSVREAFPHEVEGYEDPIELEPRAQDPLDPESYVSPDAYLNAQAALWVNWTAQRRISLGDQLGNHHFLRIFLHALRGRDGMGGPRHWLEVADTVAKADKKFGEQSRERQWLLLSSFLSLLAHARRHEGGREVPFLSTQVQLWVRELRGVVQLVSKDEVRLAWRDGLEAQRDEHWLPILYCRECGQSGLGALQREGEQQLRDAHAEIGMAFLRGDSRARFLAFGARGEDEMLQEYLCPRCLKCAEETKECKCAPPDAGGRHTACIPVRVGRALTEKKVFRSDCTSCGAEDALMFLGSRSASLSSVAVSRLYLSPFNDDRKLLAFTDSVQDASHRSGFFAARTFRFTMRTALQAALEAAREDVPLQVLPQCVLDHWSALLGEAKAIASLMPPDLREEPAYAAYAAAQKRTKSMTLAARALLLKRLSWEVAQEYGLGVAVGRSLDRTVCSTLVVDEERLWSASEKLALVLNEEQTAFKRDGFSIEDVRHFLHGLVQRLRLRGGIFDPLLSRYVQRGDRFFLMKVKQPELPRFGKHMRLPTMLFEGRAHEIFDVLFSKPGQYTWHRDWVARSLGLRVHDAGIDAVLIKALDRLVESGIAGRYPSGNAHAAGLDRTALRATTHALRVTCSECGSHLSLHREAAKEWLGRRCLRYRCRGAYAQGSDASREAGYYQRLYRSGHIARVFAGEHTGLLDRHVREALEIAFKTQPQPDSPNLLTCTPTLEMGIDIGDLSSVLLCAVPPLPSNYLQRVGRAGRKTGNAAVLTMVTSRPHDLYFHSAPTEMLRGEVAPPGCFLDAPEVLIRQMLAHAMDQWARTAGAGRIPPSMKLLPKKAKEGSFPHSFYGFYAQRREPLLTEFLALFAEHISEPSERRLRAAVQEAGLLEPMKRAFDNVQEERQQLRQRLKQLDARAQALKDDPSLAEPSTAELLEPESRTEAELEEIREARAAYARVLDELGNKHPINVLTDAGVLPNYAFPEPGVTLKTLLRGPKGEGGQGKQAKRELQRYEYMRPASSAIREFAPFNTFYAEGHKVKVSQVDVGSRARPLLEQWRFCPACHHSERVIEEQGVVAGCPKCGTPQFKDQGQKRWMVHFRQAWSAMDLMAASTAEDTEEREEQSYTLAELINVEQEHQRGGWLVNSESLVFGYELLQGLTLRELNLGVRGNRGDPVEIAARKYDQKGFKVCRDCGKVQPKKAPRAGEPIKTEHAPYCKVRTAPKTKEQFETIYLYREIISEAIRVLLPVSDYGVERKLPTVSAALQLGFRRKFRGQASHLRITTTTECIHGTQRRYLVIYDTVPGGTGYLSELAKGDPLRGSGFLEVMQLALDHMRDCACSRDEDKDGCYRCVYAYQGSNQLANISRREAVELFEQVLRQRRQMTKTESLTLVPVDAVLESELEARFIAALAEHAELQRWGWEKSLSGGRQAWKLSLEDSSWVFEPQVALGPQDGVAECCRPDFVARCTTDASVLPIAIFCDGLQYHACPDSKEARIWDDIKKREALLVSGKYRIWSLTWKDVTDFAGQSRHGAATLLAPSEPQQAKMAAERLAQQTGRQLPPALEDLNGMHQLLLFLTAPKAAAWGDACCVFGVGALALRKPFAQEAIAALRKSLGSEAEKKETVLERAAAPGAVVAGHERRPWVELLVESPLAAMKKADFSALTFQLRLFDDHESRKNPGFEESWRAALHAWNVLQFHQGSVSITSTERLLLDGSESIKPAQQARLDTWRPLSEVPEAAAMNSALVATSDEYAEARPLTHALLAQGLPAPVEFQGLGDSGVELDAILAWPELRIALWYDESDASAWAARGWQLFGVETTSAEQIAEAVAAGLAKRREG